MRAVFVIVLYLFCACQSQQLPLSFTGMSFSHDVKMVSLPFRLVNNLMLMPMHINSSDTLFFILDTGVKTTLITELDASQALSLNYARRQKIRGLGQGEELEAIHSYGNEFYLPHIVGKNQDVLVLVDDIFFLSSKLGMQVNGLTGYDIFEHLVVEINYEQKKIFFHQPKYFRPKKNFIELPLEIAGGKPYLKAQVNLDGQNIDVKLLMDTGASYAISLESNPEKGISVPQKNIPAYLGRGLSGEINGHLARISQLKIDKFNFENVLTAFPDSTSLAGMAALNQRNGSLGADVLRRFHIIFDYANAKIYLKPNAFYKEKFKNNMSGMELSMPIPNVPVFVISQISDNSPAQKAQLQVGDQILKINGINAVNMSLNEFSELFQSQEGRKIRLLIKREEQSFKVEIILRASI